MCIFQEMQSQVSALVSGRGTVSQATRRQLNDRSRAAAVKGVARETLHAQSLIEFY